MGPGRTEHRSVGQWLWSLVFDDLWRKLAALGLAFGLWSYLNAQLTVQERTTLTPLLVSPSALGSSLSNTKLSIALDLNSYGVASMTSEDGEPIGSVDLIVHGPRRLVALLPTVPGFRTQPEIVDDDGVPTAVIEAGDIFLEEPRLADLRVEIEPPSIHLQLARLTQEQITLTPARVSRTPPSGGGSNGLFERFAWSRMTFPENPSFTLIGPDERVREIAQGSGPLYRIAQIYRPSTPDPSSVRLELEPTFELGTEGGAGLRALRSLFAEMPLEVDEVEFTLPEVPVVLHDPFRPAPAVRFVLRRGAEELRIAATGRLQARLLTLDDERRQDWVRENCVIVATVPPGTTEPDVISRPHVIVGPDYREGRDYKITVPLTIQYERAPAGGTEQDQATEKQDKQR